MKRDRKPANDTSVSRSASNVVALLQALVEKSEPLSLSEIGRICAIPKATAFRYLNALAKAGYVMKDRKTGDYSLGPAVIELSRRFFGRNEILEGARDSLPQLAAASDETAHLAILTAPQVAYIDMAESQQRVRAFITRGERLPAYCVASGRAILAFADDEVVEAVIAAGLKPRTKNTISDRGAFLKELKLTKKNGYAVAIGEWMEDVVGISAPLFAPDGSVVGAIGVSCPLSRVSKEKIAVLGGLVRSHASSLASLPAGRTRPKSHVLEQQS